jgi:hypothetical protein
MKGVKKSGRRFNAWYFRPLHWVFFLVWAAILSFSKLLKDLGEKQKNRRTG